MATSRVTSDGYTRHFQFGEPTNERMHSVLAASCIASLAQVNFGYALGYSAQAELTNYFKELFNFKKTNNHFSIFASMVAVGAMVGCLLSGVLVDKIGRKLTIICTAFFYISGWLLIGFLIKFNHKIQTLLYLGRVVTGIGVGISSMAVPLYIAEVASAKTRGGFGNINQLSINFGFVVSYFVGLVDNNGDLYYTSLVPVGISVLNVFFMVWMPETPRWLLANNKRHKAIIALSWFRGSNYEVEEECFEIESSLGFVNFEEEHEKWTMADLKEPVFFRPMIIAVALMFFQEYSGINAILFYCSSIFKKAGFNGTSFVIPNDSLDSSAQEAALAVGVTLFVFTLISCFLVDRVGRRKLLLTGSVVMVIVLFLLGTYFKCNPSIKPTTVRSNVTWTTYEPMKLTALNNVHTISNLTTTVRPQTPQYYWFTILTLVATLLYIAFFSIGWGPLPWLLMSEIFPLKTRGLALSVVTFTNWLFVFMTTVIFGPVQVIFGDYGIFFFFGSLSVIGLIFTLFCVPETKGQRLEDTMFLFLHKRVWQMSRPCGGEPQPQNI